MSIFNRIKQLAKAELNEVKRVIREGQAQQATPPPPSAPPPGSEGSVDDDLARGAAIWAAAAGDPETPPVTTTEAPAPPVVYDAEFVDDAPVAAKPSGWPVEYRQAYATLGLPLGASLDAVEEAFLQLEEALPDERFGNDERAQNRAATSRAERQHARDLLARHLSGRGF